MQMITQKHFFTTFSRRLIYLTSSLLLFHSALMPASLALDFEDNLQELDRAVPADAGTAPPADAGSTPLPQEPIEPTGGSQAPPAGPAVNNEPAVFVEPVRRETRPPAYIPPPTEPSFTTIRFGESKPGVLGQADTITDDGRRYEYFEFEGRQGQPIVITLKGSEDERASGNLSLMPYMVIFSPSCDFTTPDTLAPNCIIARNDVAGGTRTLADERLRLRLPEEGKYIVAVFSDPGTEGRFSLSLQRDTVIYRYEWAGELTEEAARLESDDSPIAYHQFSGGQGQFVNILAVSPDFDSYLFLLDPDGNVIAQNDDGGGNLNAFIETELPEDGLYTIVVNAFDPQGQGRYRLLVY
ncbi:MAG: hypothetical protein Kow00121_24340 [Elainellaceae cyanobacterium]